MGSCPDKHGKSKIRIWTEKSIDAFGRSRHKPRMVYCEDQHRTVILQLHERLIRHSAPSLPNHPSPPTPPPHPNSLPLMPISLQKPKARTFFIHFTQFCTKTKDFSQKKPRLRYIGKTNFSDFFSHFTSIL